LYHYWTPSKIVQSIVRREHPLPKLFKRMPALTRMERYAAMSSAMQTAFFFQAFLFNPKCHMVPQPSGCRPPLGLLEKFLPSWMTVIVALQGLMLAVPVPLSIILQFRKVPVQERLSPEEKQAKIFGWRLSEAIGWTWVILLNVFFSFFLIRFSCEYDWAVFEKWINAGYQSLIHRFVTAPCGRSLVIALVVVASKSCAFLDPCFVCFPHLIPVGQPRIPMGALDKDGNKIKKGDKRSEDDQNQDGGDDGGDMGDGGD